MTLDLHAYWALLVRRWAVIVPAIVLVPLLTLVLAIRQEKVYSANAQVLLTYTNIGATLNGLATNYAATAPTRNVATQAALARTAPVARDALRLAGVSASPTDLLNESSVTSSLSADLLGFSVNASSPARAMDLATSYARAYTLYRGQIDNQAITSALEGITRQLSALQRSGGAGTPSATFLGHEQERLAAMQAAGANDAVLVAPAQSATRVGPHPARSAALGLAVGLVLAVALVFLMETLDKRAGVEEIGERLRLSHLAAIPVPSAWQRAKALASAIPQQIREKQLAVTAAIVTPSSPDTQTRAHLYNRRRTSSTRTRTRAARGGEPVATQIPAAQLVSADPGPEVPPLAVLRDPHGHTAEAFSVLKSSLEFAGLEHEFTSLLLTSARSYRGKAELAANLAVTMTRGGRRVLLCDLDARRASITSLFGLEERPGVTEVALGSSALEQAMVTIPAVPGDLMVLPTGSVPPHSGFLGTRAVADLIESLRHVRADLVLIDAPPLRASGEAQTLGALADALIVALADPVRPAVLNELAVTLSRVPARPLGFITVGVARETVEVAAPGSGAGGGAADLEVQPLAAPSNGHGPRSPAHAGQAAIRGSGDTA